MPRKRHSAEQIVAKLRQIDVLVAQGHTMPRFAMRPRLRSRAITGGAMSMADWRWSRPNDSRSWSERTARFKRLAADLSLENQILKDAAEGNL